MEKLIDTIITIMIFVVFLIIPIVTNILKKKTDKKSGSLKKLIDTIDNTFNPEPKKSSPPEDYENLPPYKTVYKQEIQKDNDSNQKPLSIEDAVNFREDKLSEIKNRDTVEKNLKKGSSNERVTVITKKNSGFKKINKLSPLQKAIIMNEILSKPKSLQ